jgi:hypothetical protein
VVRGLPFEKEAGPSSTGSRSALLAFNGAVVELGLAFAVILSVGYMERVAWSSCIVWARPLRITL